MYLQNNSPHYLNPICIHKAENINNDFLGYVLKVSCAESHEHL